MTIKDLNEIANSLFLLYGTGIEIRFCEPSFKDTDAMCILNVYDTSFGQIQTPVLYVESVDDVVWRIIEIAKARAKIPPKFGFLKRKESEAHNGT